jgi:hypothetical protein
MMDKTEIDNWMHDRPIGMLNAESPIVAKAVCNGEIDYPLII